jgi:hypothetical protein
VKGGANFTLLVIANLLIPVTSFYLFGILNHHGPSGNESVAILLYVVGLLVVVLDFFFIFKKRRGEPKGFSFLNVILLLSVFVHVAVNSLMFFLVMALFQL